MIGLRPGRAKSRRVSEKRNSAACCSMRQPASSLFRYRDAQRSPCSRRRADLIGAGGWSRFLKRGVVRVAHDSAALNTPASRFTQTVFLVVQCAGSCRCFPAPHGRGFGRALWARLCGGLRRRRGLPKPVGRVCQPILHGAVRRMVRSLLPWTMVRISIRSPAIR